MKSATKMNNEQVNKINNKIIELEYKKRRTTLQTVKDYIDGVITGIEWCKREL